MRIFRLHIGGIYLLGLVLLGPGLLWAPPVQSDEISVQGQRLRNVYVTSNGTNYLVHNPTNGAVIRVPKSWIGVDDLNYNPSPKLRLELFEKWQAKRAVDEEIALRHLTYEEWKAQQAKTEEVDAPPIELPHSRDGMRAIRAKNGTITITNRKRSNNGRLNGRNMFINKNGNTIITNTPEVFRGKTEYVEVVIHYEPIDIPDQFRHGIADPRMPMDDATFEDIVHHYAKVYDLDTYLIFAVIKAESNGNPNAVSSAGARGLMQLMPSTAREMGVNDIFDPVENIAGGTQYLSKLLKLYRGNIPMALAGYNAGPGNVRKYNGIPPFGETREYIARVQRFSNQYQRSGTLNLHVARTERPSNDYLPESDGSLYTIYLDNDHTIPAEKITYEDGRYIYTYEGQSGHVREDQVRGIRKPS